LQETSSSPSLALAHFPLLRLITLRHREEEAAFNAERTDALAQGTTWERICTMVDLQDSRSKTSTKSKQDLSRFKEVLLSLKHEGENAPGAAGY
jgi:hypothetical protein